jgi:hypothetical protein
MTIHRLIQNLAFNQDDIDRLAAAYEDALRVLHISDRDDPVNEVIARRIIEGTRAGVRDANALCQMAIKDLRALKAHPNFIGNPPLEAARPQRFAVKG